MATTYNPTTTTEDLLLFFDAANVKSYSGTGSSWKNMSKQKKNTTAELKNNAKHNNAKKGRMDMDGANDYIDIDGVSEIEFSDVTFSFAAHHESLDSDQVYISKGRFRRDEPFFVFFDKRAAGRWEVNSGNRNTISVATSDGDREICIAGPTNMIEVGEVFFIDVTIDASAGTVSLYKNGEFVVSYTNSNYTGIEDNNDLRIGADERRNKDLDGSIYFLKIYTRCLQADEIKQNYNNLKGRYQ